MNPTNPTKKHKLILTAPGFKSGSLRANIDLSLPAHRAKDAHDSFRQLLPKFRAGEAWEIKGSSSGYTIIRKAISSEGFVTLQEFEETLSINYSANGGLDGIDASFNLRNQLDIMASIRRIANEATKQVASPYWSHQWQRLLSQTHPLRVGKMAAFFRPDDQQKITRFLDLARQAGQSGALWFSPEIDESLQVALVDDVSERLEALAEEAEERLQAGGKARSATVQAAYDDLSAYADFIDGLTALESQVKVKIEEARERAKTAWEALEKGKPAPAPKVKPAPAPQPKPQPKPQPMAIVPDNPIPNNDLLKQWFDANAGREIDNPALLKRRVEALNPEIWVALNDPDKGLIDISALDGRVFVRGVSS